MSKVDNVLTNTDKRLFYLSDDIDETSIGKMNYNLLYLLQEDEEMDGKEKDYRREPIRIYVNSGGGDVYDMWGLIDIIQNSKTPIYTYCTGYAMSAAFLIFLAGHKRYASKHATFLYHQAWHRISGKYQDLVEHKDELDWIDQTIKEYTVSRTKITKDRLEDVQRRKQDWFIHTDEALVLGIIDAII